MRSSWLASATNWRTCVSDSCRAASAASTCPSIRFSAVATWPTSLVSSVSCAGTRSRITAPRSSGCSETRAAVSATRSSGTISRRTSAVPAIAATASPATTMMISPARYALTVEVVSAMDSPVTSVRPPASCAITR